LQVRIVAWLFPGGIGDDDDDDTSSGEDMDVDEEQFALEPVKATFKSPQTSPQVQHCLYSRAVLWCVGQETRLVVERYCGVYQRKDKKKKKKRGDPDYDSDEDDEDVEDGVVGGKGGSDAASGLSSAKPGAGPAAQTADAESFVDDDRAQQGTDDEDTHLDLDFELKPLLEPNETVDGVFDCQRVKVRRSCCDVLPFPVRRVDLEVFFLLLTCC
jgi:hypothetical protein